MDVVLPTLSGSFVYMLVSKVRPEVTYIGETGNLARRLDAHYSGIASKQTAIEDLRPWGLLAFVTGFENDFGGMKRKAFESQWKWMRQRMRPGATCLMAAELAKHVMVTHMRNYPEDKLRYVQAGGFVDK